MGWVVNATPRPLYPRKETWYPLCWSPGGPQGRYGWVRKILSPPGFDPRSVEPVASRYTDCLLYVMHIIIISVFCRLKYIMKGSVHNHPLCTGTYVHLWENHSLSDGLILQFIHLFSHPLFIASFSLCLFVYLIIYLVLYCQLMLRISLNLVIQGVAE
jgi:hypothetical protein